MKSQVLPAWLKDQLKHSNEVHELKLPSVIVPISRLPLVLAAPRGFVHNVEQTKFRQKKCRPDSL